MNKKSKIALAIISAAFTGQAAYADDSMHGGSMGNPTVSVALEGRYVSQDTEGFALHGFQATDSFGHLGNYENGFSTGHNAVTISSNIAKSTSGTLDFAIESHDGSSSIDVEEAYIETSALGNGISVKVGQFFSGIGNQNAVHGHHQDFANASLVYIGMFGGHLSDTGVQFKWSQSGGVNLQIGAEITTGASFPGGGNNEEKPGSKNEDNNAGLGLFAKAGGSIGSTQSWKAGASLYSSEFGSRHSGGHHADSTESFAIEEGTVDVTGIDLEYLFSPNGKGKAGELKVSMEYFMRDEDGTGELTDTAPDPAEIAEADYKGEQSGYYLAAVYRFKPQWRAGIRLDHLESDNVFTNVDNPDGLMHDGAVIADGHDFAHATQMGSDHDPERSTVMVDYAPNSNSVIRAQFMKDEAGEVSENRIYLQYVVTLGGHGH